jgi:hypothetical protein
MLKLTPWSGILLLLSGCSVMTAQQPPLPNVNTSSNEANLPLSGENFVAPDIQCSGLLPRSVEVSIEDYRLVQRSDFIPAIQNFKRASSTEVFTCGIFTADFDGDGDRDYALLLVNDETKQFRAQFSLNQGNDTFEPMVLRTYSAMPTVAQGEVVYTSMSFKPKGEAGLALRDYSPLQSRDREVYTERPAIALWRAILTDDQGLPADFEISTLAYCSDAYYFINGKLETFSVCD